MAKRSHATYALQLALCLALSAGFARAQQSGNSSGTCNPSGPRVFCAYNGVDQGKCEGQYGCCFDDSQPTTVGTGGAPLQIPICYYKNGGDSSYTLGGLEDGPGGVSNGALTLSQGVMTDTLGADISSLDLTVNQLSPSILRVTIGARGRWTVPQDDIFNDPSILDDRGAPALDFQSSNSPFAFTVARVGSTSPAIFDTTGQRLVFKDQYIELTSKVPATSAFYGLGERTPSTGLQLLRQGIPIALWNRDNPAADPDENIYGSHPNYLELRPDGTAHGVVMMNSNGMDVVLNNDTIQFRIVGGIIDLYFLAGPTPNAVNDQLTQIIGRPVMPPYWAMGLMQSKFGYDNSDYYTYVIDNYAAAGIPLETFVADSQYMDRQMGFTLGANFTQSEMSAFISRLHSNGQRFVPILDPFIHLAPNYGAYESGLQADAFLKDVSGKPYIGQSWPGAVNWPDFRSPDGIQWWQSQMAGLHNLIDYDGLWLDMNEVSNYCSGDVCQDPGPSVGEQLRFICQVGCQSGRDTATNGSTSNTNQSSIPPESYFTVPYSINNGNQQLTLSTKTLAVTVAHHDGELEYNLHNLYGLYEVIATYRQLITMRQKRPFILTRATWLGSGGFSAHWTGDTLSSEADMQWTIPSILNNGLAGITFSGADICGFSQYASENLCARWAALGAWYPFSRNHHADGFQEFYRWASVAEVARKAFGMRYRAMPYLYTAFFDSHQFGCPTMRPLFFTFPNDQQTWTADTQFMIGDGLMVVPCLQENGTSVNAYFPQGMWYSIYNYVPVDASTAATTLSLEVGITDDIPVYVLGGTVVPLGEGGLTTDVARNSSLTLLVAMPGSAGNDSAPSLCGLGCPDGAAACGHMYLDGGEELEVGSALDNYITMTATTTTAPGGGTSGHLDVQFAGSPNADGDAACSAGISWPTVSSILLLGVNPVDTSSVTLQTISPGAGSPGAVSTASVGGDTSTGLPLSAGTSSYDQDTRTLNIDNLNVQLSCPDGFRLSWSSAAASPVQSAG